MAKNRISLGLDIQTAIRQMEDLPNAVDDGAASAVRQLAVLAEGAMKAEAPEGAGRDRHMRDSVDTRFPQGRDGKVANVGARKRASDGVLLATYVVEGTDSTSYDVSPEMAAFLGHQMEDWAAAKVGDPSAAYPIAWSIIRSGHATLPNRFVDRSLAAWEDQVEDVAGEKVQAAMSRLMRGT